MVMAVPPALLTVDVAAVSTTNEKESVSMTVIWWLPLISPTGMPPMVGPVTPLIWT
jgi:hypothetical protein